MPEGNLDNDKGGTALLTSKKITSSVAGYIWESPCLKPLVYNPYILSLMIVMIIWTIDMLYRKTFEKEGYDIIAQHMLLTYVLVACGITMNNMLIKHRYRTEKNNKEEATAKNTSLISEYVADS